MEQRYERDDQKIDWLESENAKLRDERDSWKGNYHRVLEREAKQIAEKSTMLLQNGEFRKALELIRDNTGKDDGEYAIHIATQTVGPLTGKPKDERALCGQWEPGLGQCVAYVPCKAHAENPKCVCGGERNKAPHALNCPVHVEKPVAPSPKKCEVTATFGAGQGSWRVPCRLDQGHPGACEFDR